MNETEPRQRQTPLQQAGMVTEPLTMPGLSLREVPDVSLLRLHSLADSSTLDSAIEKAGISLPPDTGAVIGEEPTVLCLRPGEWLLISEAMESENWMARLEPLLEPVSSALLDASDGFGLFRLSGPAAPWLLAKLSGLDFLAGAAEGPHGTRTRMGDVAVIVRAGSRVGQEPRFDLVFDRSVAPYLWGLLQNAAAHACELFERHGAAA